MTLQVVVFLLGVLCFQYANGQNGAVCMAVKDNPTTFKVVFTYDKTIEPTVTGLESYTVAEDPDYVTPVTDGECANTTPGLSQYTIAYEIDTTAGSLPCGIEETGVDTDVYKFAIAPAGLSLVYTFTCDLLSLDLPAKVSQSDFETNHLQATTDVYFSPQVVLTVTNQPGTEVAEVPIGWPIRLRLTYANDDRIGGLSIISLIVGNTAAFDDKVETVITDGCNTNNAESALKDIGLFRVIYFYTRTQFYQTNVFGAFRLDPDPSTSKSVWFRVTYESCFGDLTRCNGCSRRKRSDDQDRQTVDVELRVTDAPTPDQEDNEEGQGRTVCGTIILYWAPHVLLLLMTLVECAAISHVLRKKVQLR